MEAHRSSTPRGPWTPSSSSARTTPTAAVLAPHASISLSASTAGDTRPMSRTLVPAVSPFAGTVGYSRAVREGHHVHVAGTAPIFPDGVQPPADAYSQAKRCLPALNLHGPLGSFRHSDLAPVTSGLLLKADFFRAGRHVSKVPTPDSCTACKLRPRWITSSARLTDATGGSGWSADSVSKIMKRPGRVLGRPRPPCR